MRRLLTTMVLSTLAFGGPDLAAGNKSKEPVHSSRQEYRACLDLQERLTSQLKILQDHVAENNNTIALLRDAAKALAEKHQDVSPFDTSQVDDFNALMEEHNNKVEAASKEAERVKGEHEAYHLQSVEYNKTCATLAVSLDDRDAVLHERDSSGQTSMAVPSPEVAGASPSP